MSQILAVAFDLDGLMFNTEELYNDVGSELLARRGQQFTPELRDRMMGRPGRVALQIMIDWHGLDATVEQLQNETDEIFAEILDASLAPMPGLMQLLDVLEQHKRPKAICTSSRRNFVDNVLGRFDLASRFEFILTAENVEHGKPDPEIYQTAAARFGVSPAQMMVLEDSQNGFLAAKAAGAFVVAVPGHPSAEHDFAAAHLQAASLLDPRIYEALNLPSPT